MRDYGLFFEAYRRGKWCGARNSVGYIAWYECSCGGGERVAWPCRE